MTEQLWLTSTNPWDMVDFIYSKPHSRKLRLFACACCRQVLNPFVPPFVARAVTAAEAFADGEMSSTALAQVREFVATVSREETRNGTGYFSDVLGACLSACCQSVNAGELAQDTSHATASAAGDGPLREGLRVVRVQDRPPEFVAELALQADLLRDIFGNPFRSLELQVEWLTETVVALARGIYEDRAFDRMPILADALQDAGCADEDILNHCRGEREHARGCWVVDLLLGKA